MSDVASGVIAFFVMLFAIIVILLVASLLLAFPFMWLWNYAVVFAFPGVSPLDYWHSYWLFMFVSIFITGTTSGRSKSKEQAKGAKMKFKKKMPKTYGYYWYVNISYPDPAIGFCSGAIDAFYDANGNMYTSDSMYMRENFRFGDKIEKPKPADNEIET